MHPCRTVCPLYVHTSGFTCKVRPSRNCHCYYSHERSLWQPTLHTFSSNDRSACICHPRGLTFMWLGVLRFISSDIKQSSKPTPFVLFLLFISVFTALSTIFHSMNSPYYSLFSHCSSSLFFCHTGEESQRRRVCEESERKKEKSQVNQL